MSSFKLQIKSCTDSFARRYSNLFADYFSFPPYSVNLIAVFLKTYASLIKQFKNIKMIVTPRRPTSGLQECIYIYQPITGRQRCSVVRRYLRLLLAARSRLLVHQDVRHIPRLFHDLLGRVRLDVALSRLRLLGRQSVRALRHQQRLPAILRSLSFRQVLQVATHPAGRSTRHADMQAVRCNFKR